MKIVKPYRVKHTYVQTINEDIKVIMPLYCPVKETEWCENWDPKTIYSYSGVVEKECIFITSNGVSDITWVVTDYEVEKGYVKMFYHIPELLITMLEIQLTPLTKNQTKAVISYSKTSLSELGNEALKEFTTNSYHVMMGSWEKAMNHFLKTGTMLTGLPNF